MKLYRELMDKLVSWRKRPDRKPLVISGMRGVGKTTVVKEFAEKYFEKMVVFDLENPDGKLSFDGVLLRDPFDDVIMKYKEFREDKENDLVVFDGLNEERIGKNTADDIIRFLVAEFRDYNICIVTSLDVKRVCRRSTVKGVELHKLYPMNLKEFMIANHAESLVDAVHTQMQVPLDPAQRFKMQQYISVYLITGGMPEVIKTYLTTRDLKAVDEARKKSVQTYMRELDRIPDEGMRKRAGELIRAIPKQLDSKEKIFEYEELRLFFSARKHYEKALDWLKIHQMVTVVKEWEADRKEKKKTPGEKMFLTDVGLLSFLGETSFEDLVTAEDFYGYRNGMYTHQFVLQQLQTSLMKEPYYFLREKKGGVAFLCRSGGEQISVVLMLDGQTKVQDMQEELKKTGLLLYVTADTMDWQENEMKIPAYALWNL